MSQKYIKLINVSDKNNNKYYELVDNGNGTFTVSWGRVGQGSQSKTYPIKDWYTKYNEKIRKGYKDITDMLIAEKKIQYNIDNDEISLLINKLQQYTSQQLSDNYFVSSKNVTTLQLKKANQYLQDALHYSNIVDKNAALLELYKTIPRKMKNVNDYLYQNKSQFISLYNDEKELLNNLIVHTEIVESNVVESLNIAIEVATDEDIVIINKLIKDTSNCNRSNMSIKKAFKVINKPTQVSYDSHIRDCKNKLTQLVWHGSRNPNWLSILKIGLKIRPEGVQLSGNIYGNGIYGSTCLDKSLGYTGSFTDKFLSIQEFHVGNQFTYNGWYKGNSFELTYEELRKRDYDSTFVKPGDGLLNNEYIIYKEQQTTIKYLVWL